MQEKIIPRPMILFIKQTKGQDLIGAEIGVDKGIHAEEICKVLKPKSLFLIDPWNNFIDKSSNEIIGEAQFLITKERLKDYKEVTIMRNKSEEVAKYLPDENFDFVYIDGDHSYNGIVTDIMSWYPKVKVGGVLGGHDYHFTIPGVVQAVNDFVKQMNLKLYQNGTDWWTIKC